MIVTFPGYLQLFVYVSYHNKGLTVFSGCCIDNYMLVSFNIRFIRRDQKQRRNGEAWTGVFVMLGVLVYFVALF